MGMNKNSANKESTSWLQRCEYQGLADKAAEIDLKPSTVARRMLLEHIRFLPDESRSF